MEIRRIREDEGSAVARLWDAMGREVPGGSPMPAHALGRIEHMLTSCAWHERSFCLVALRDTRILGFITGTLVTGDGLLPGTSGEIETCYVVPKARRVGIGTALAKAAISWLNGLGADPIHLETSLDDESARAFWLSLDFEPESIRMALHQS